MVQMKGPEGIIKIPREIDGVVASDELYSWYRRMAMADQSEDLTGGRLKPGVLQIIEIIGLLFEG